MAQGFLWRRHAAVADHRFGEVDRGALVDVLAVDVIAVREAKAECILNAPPWCHFDMAGRSVGLRDVSRRHSSPSKPYPAG
jgi:hypothetical protein